MESSGTAPLPRDVEGMEVVLGVSVGGSRARHWIVPVARDGARHRYLTRGHVEMPGAAPYPEVAARLERIAEQMRQRGARDVYVVADVTTGGRIANQVLSVELDTAVRDVTGVRIGEGNAPGVLSRGEIASWLGGLMSMSRLFVTDQLAELAEQFQLRPESRLPSGEEAWRIDDQDGASLALGAALYHWRWSLASDATGGRGGATISVPARAARLDMPVPMDTGGWTDRITQTAYIQGRIGRRYDPRNPYRTRISRPWGPGW